jgi:hypothetical protein
VSDSVARPPAAEVPEDPDLWTEADFRAALERVAQDLAELQRKLTAWGPS